ncbi:putative phage holin (plasmid) [Streptomyces sp. GDS52]|uniref:putative phage holin n=1 Tax=Streptomyces sp. GDS52 TaxID=3406419 RepID=UPI003FD48289
MNWAQITNLAASGLVALASLVFVIAYHLHAPWRSTVVGRHLMGFTAAIGALGAYTIAITIWPDGAAASVLRTARTALLVVIACLVVQRIRMVVTVQHQGALLGTRAPHDQPGPPPTA